MAYGPSLMVHLVSQGRSGYVPAVEAAEARKLEHDRPATPNQRKKKRKPALIILHPSSNFLEFTVHTLSSL